MKKASVIDKLFWVYILMRKYERNNTSFVVSIVMTAFTYGVLGFFIWLYNVAYIFPEAFAFAIGASVVCGLIPVLYANHILWACLLNICLGTIAYYHKWDLGFSIFGNHFEQGMYLIFIVGGFLGVVRYLWNAFVWWQHDRIKAKHNFSGVLK